MASTRKRTRVATGVYTRTDSKGHVIFDINYTFVPLTKAMDTTFDSGGLASAPADEVDTTTVEPSPYYAYVDACGNTVAWIPMPEEGAIELPIFIVIIGSSFIAIIVIRRKRKESL